MLNLRETKIFTFFVVVVFTVLQVQLITCILGLQVIDVRETDVKGGAGLL